MSDEIKDKKDDNKDDPYNFFKFAGPDNNDKKKKDDDNNRSRFPLWALMLLVLAVLALVNMFVMSKPDNLVDFSDALSKTERSFRSNSAKPILRATVPSAQFLRSRARKAICFFPFKRAAGRNTKRSAYWA